MMAHITFHFAFSDGAMKLDEMERAEISLPFDSVSGLTCHAFCYRVQCFDDDTRRDARHGVMMSAHISSPD